MNIRKTILVLFVILLVGGLAVWWYFGFTLDFMRFFAADTGVVGPVKSAPPGCYYQEVQCFRAPCDPVLVCPSSSPTGGGMVQCSPTTQTVQVGAQTTVTATSGSGTYSWFAPESNLPSRVSETATFSVSYRTSGTKKVTVQSPRGDGSSNIDSVACTVIVTQ